MTLINKAASVLRKKMKGLQPRMVLTLGSGLGAVADLMKDTIVIPYQQIPGFPPTTVAGHAGTLSMGTVEGVPVIFMKGRKHLYEDPIAAAAAIKHMIRTFKTLGVDTMFLTNAAGSLRAEYGPGSLVAISDHINLTGFNPLVGPNDDEWGPRFPPMENCWDSELRMMLMEEGKKAGIKHLGEGVYAQHMGPTFETPAEVRFSKIIGADTVGMSTAVENIVARHCGLKCVGVSAITNLGAGLGLEPLSHEQTLDGAKLAEEKMAALVRVFIKAWGAKYGAAPVAKAA